MLLMEGITVAMGTIIFSIETAGLASMKLIALSSVIKRVHNSFGGTPSTCIIPLEPLKVFEMFLDGHCSFVQNLLCKLPST